MLLCSSTIAYWFKKFWNSTIVRRDIYQEWFFLKRKVIRNHTCTCIYCTCNQTWGQLQKLQYFKIFLTITITITYSSITLLKEWLQIVIEFLICNWITFMYIQLVFIASDEHKIFKRVTYGTAFWLKYLPDTLKILSTGADGKLEWLNKQMQSRILIVIAFPHKYKYNYNCNDLFSCNL